jgi:hypothetical protein
MSNILGFSGSSEVQDPNDANAANVEHLIA